MYIIRTAFLASAVVFLLPAEKQDTASNSETPNTAHVSAGDTLGAAISAVGDISNICSRQPDVCATGSAMWQTFQVKARYGIELLYEWATDDGAAKPNKPETQARMSMNGSYRVSENTAPLYTGSAKSQKPQNSAQTTTRPKSQNTLEIQDLIPQWKGPGASKNA